MQDMKVEGTNTTFIVGLPLVFLAMYGEQIGIESEFLHFYPTADPWSAGAFYYQLFNIEEQYLIRA